MRRVSSLSLNSCNDVFDNHKISRSKGITIVNAIPRTFFFILFPYLFVYRYYSAINAIPTFMDGYFAVIELFIAVILGIYYVRNDLLKVRGVPLAISILFGFLLFNIVSWALIHRGLGFGEIATNDLLVSSMRLALGLISMFLVGYYIKITGKWRLLYVGYALIIFTTLSNINSNNVRLDLSSALSYGLAGVYLELATVALFTGLFVWANLNNTIAKGFSLLTTLILLFLIASRASFYTYLIVLPILLYFTYRINWRKALYLFTLSALGFIYLFITIDMISTSRHFQIINLARFTSLQARINLLTEGILDILSFPITGNYAKFVVGYIHNVLSVWQSFGLLAFILYSLIILLCVYYIVLLILKKLISDNYTQLVIVLVIVVTIEILFSKAVGYKYIALVWGMVAKSWQENFAS